VNGKVQEFWLDLDQVNRARTAQTPKLTVRVRFPSPAPSIEAQAGSICVVPQHWASGHPVVPHPRAGQVKITRIGSGIAGDRTSTGAARPGSMEKPR